MNRRWTIISLLALVVILISACGAPLTTLNIPTDQRPLARTSGASGLVTADEEQTLIKLYRQVNPGVVSIRVLKRGPMDQAAGGAGSGFIYDAQGHVVTNAHVVRDADLIDVVLHNETIVAAEVIGLDDDSDLAVLKVDLPTDQRTPLPLGDSDAVVPGQRVIAIGNPFGQQSSMTTGIVSAVGRIIPSLTPFSIPQAIQTDAAINPGNSGGPLLNLKGEVIGVNAQIESTVRANSGVGFAIPVNIVKRVVPALIEAGEFTWPWLGVGGVSLTPRIAKANELSVQRGAYIVDVPSEGPAASAGLQGASSETEVDGLPIKVGGDVVVAADGEPIRSMDDLILFISQHQPGDQVALTVVRDGEQIEVSVTLATRPEELGP